MSNLYAIRVRDIWEYLRTQDTAFWLICIYLLFEYVRPQTIYPTIDVLPWVQIVLILTSIALLMKGELSLVKNIENRLLIAYFFVIVLSSIFGLSPDVSFAKISDFVAWMLIYFLIINIVNTENRFFVFILSFLLYNFKMAQHSFLGWARIGFGFSSWGTGGGPGWFHNSGEFGIAMCVFFPLSAYFCFALSQNWGKWKKNFFWSFPFMALTGMVSSSSRGAVVGGASVLLWMLIKSRHRIKGLICVAIIAFLFLQFLPEEQRVRFQSAGDDQTSTNRMDRWKKGIELVRMFPLLGVGFKNWAVADTRFFGDGGGECHNIFIECMSELGYTGLSVFILMILFTFTNNNHTRKIALTSLNNNRFLYFMAHGIDGALVGYLVSGFFVTVLYYPYFWINLAMTVALNNTARKMADDANDRKCQEAKLATNDA